GELKELLGAAVVEPVYDSARNDTSGLGIIGKDFDVQPLIDDLPDLFLSSVSESYSRVISHTSEHYSDFFPQLVDEDCGGLGLVQRARDLAERLGHEAGLEADVAVPHLALDLGPGHEGGYRVDDDDVDGPGADEHVGDLQRLLTGVRLGDEQPVGVDAELFGVFGVERVLGVDECGDPARLLGVCHRVEGQTRFSAGLRSVYFDNSAAGQAADSEGYVERDGPGRDHLHRGAGIVTEPHDRAPAELPLDLGECGLQGLLPVAALDARPIVRCHVNSREDQGLPARPCARRCMVDRYCQSVLPGPGPAGLPRCQRRRYAPPPTISGRPGWCDPASRPAVCSAQPRRTVRYVYSLDEQLFDHGHNTPVLSKIALPRRQTGARQHARTRSATAATSTGPVVSTVIRPPMPEPGAPETSTTRRPGGLTGQRSRSGTSNAAHTARQTVLTSSPSARAWFTVRSPSSASTWSLATLCAYVSPNCAFIRSQNSVRRT